MGGQGFATIEFHGFCIAVPLFTPTLHIGRLVPTDWGRGLVDPVYCKTTLLGSKILYGIVEPSMQSGLVIGAMLCMCSAGK